MIADIVNAPNWVKAIYAIFLVALFVYFVTWNPGDE